MERAEERHDVRPVRRVAGQLDRGLDHLWIRAQTNQAGADGPTPDLTDEAAYALFERACSRDYALGFRLYKVYLRAASFGALGG